MQSRMNSLPLCHVQSLKTSRSEAFLLWDFTRNQKPLGMQHAMQHSAWASLGHDLQESLRVEIQWTHAVCDWNKADSVQ